MRGDSLQDLYAKVAAVLGLGLLALSGAVVDYWPVNVAMPQMASALTTPQLGLAHAAPATPASSYVPSPRPLRARVASATAVDAAMMVIAAPDTLISALPPADVVIAERSASHELTPTVATSVPAEVVALDLPASLESAPSGDGPRMMAAPVSTSQAAAGAVDDDGFITSTMKKTGTSIVRTGVRTGSSIRDAVRVIGVKVRAVFPG